MAGQPGQDLRDRTAETVQPGQDNHGRTARRGDNRGRLVGTGQLGAGKDRQAGQRGQPGWDSRDGLTGTVQPGQDNHGRTAKDSREPGEDSRSRVVGTGKLGQASLDRIERTTART